MKNFNAVSHNRVQSFPVLQIMSPDHLARPELILISVSLKQLGIFCCRGRDARVSESFQAVSCLYPSIPLGGEERCGVNFVFVQENNEVTGLSIIDP